MRFVLMNADTPLLVFEMTDSGSLSVIKFLTDKSSLPIRVKNPAWLVARLSPSERVRDTLDELGLGEPIDFLEYTHAVSYTDTLWVNSPRNPANWASVSPYCNCFDDDLSRILLGIDEINKKSDIVISPSYTVGGAVSKAWVRRNDRVYLAKTAGRLIQENGALSGLNPFADFYASQFCATLCAALGKPQFAVPYSIDVLHGIPVSYCPAFTSESEGLAEYHEITDEPLENVLFNRAYYEDWKLMLLCDSIVLNRDRHAGNYGFITDNKTLKVKRLAPVYDFDNSFGINVPVFEFESAYELALEARPVTFSHLGFIGQKCLESQAVQPC